MRNIDRSAAAVVLIFTLAMPVGAGPRASRSGSFIDTVKRFIVRAASRISPPIGSPVVAPEEEPTTTTTDEPTKSR